MKFQLLIALPVFATWIVGAVQGQEARPDVQRLIAGMVSPNRAPELMPGRFNGRIPGGYDRTAQNAVYASISQLLTAENADLELARHIFDTDYSITHNFHGEGTFNYSVGQVAAYILMCRIEVYSAEICRDEDEPDQSLTHQPQAYILRHLNSPKAVERWCLEHESDSLFKLQLHAAQWTLDRERSLHDKQGIGCPEKMDIFVKKLKAEGTSRPPLKFSTKLRY